MPGSCYKGNQIKMENPEQKERSAVKLWEKLSGEKKSSYQNQRMICRMLYSIEYTQLKSLFKKTLHIFIQGNL